MKEPVDIKAVTDVVFSLCEDLYTRIEEYSSAQAGLFNMSGSDRMEQRELEIIEAFGAVTQPLLAAQLHATVPSAAFWWKGEPQPGSALTWVVSPAVYRFMRCAYTSIALMQDNELLLGLHLNYLESTITTGEKGDGAATFQEVHVIKDAPLSEEAAYLIHHTREVKVFPHMEQYKHFRRFTETVSSRPAYNNVIENLPGSIMGVAANRLDFTMGTGFDFPDVAASVCIAESAGGKVSDFSGTSGKLLSGDELFCSNPQIHKQFIESR